LSRLPNQRHERLLHHFLRRVRPPRHVQRKPKNRRLMPLVKLEERFLVSRRQPPQQILVPNVCLPRHHLFDVSAAFLYIHSAPPVPKFHKSCPCSAEYRVTLFCAVAFAGAPRLPDVAGSALTVGLFKIVRKIPPSQALVLCFLSAAPRILPSSPLMNLSPCPLRSRLPCPCVLRNRSSPVSRGPFHLLIPRTYHVLMAQAPFSIDNSDSADV